MEPEAPELPPLPAVLVLLLLAEPPLPPLPAAPEFTVELLLDEPVADVLPPVAVEPDWVLPPVADPLFCWVLLLDPVLLFDVPPGVQFPFEPRDEPVLLEPVAAPVFAVPPLPDVDVDPVLLLPDVVAVLLLVVAELPPLEPPLPPLPDWVADCVVFDPPFPPLPVEPELPELAAVVQEELPITVIA